LAAWTSREPSKRVFQPCARARARIHLVVESITSSTFSSGEGRSSDRVCGDKAGDKGEPRGFSRPSAATSTAPILSRRSHPSPDHFNVTVIHPYHTRGQTDALSTDGRSIRTLRPSGLALSRSARFSERPDSPLRPAARESWWTTPHPARFCAEGKTWWKVTRYTIVQAGLRSSSSSSHRLTVSHLSPRCSWMLPSDFPPCRQPAHSSASSATNPPPLPPPPARSSFRTGGSARSLTHSYLHPARPSFHA
jgi:hypothetical protein